MPRFAANLTMMFGEWPFLDRFAAAADAGFRAVEFLFPYDHPPEAVADRLSRAGLEAVLFNMAQGDFDAGERGIAALSGRRDEFRAALANATRYAEACGVKRVHMMAGLVPHDDAGAVARFRDALAEAADHFGPRGVDVVIEPLNGHDVPGYFLNDFDRAARIVREARRPNVGLQFDVYHCQIIHGDVTRRFQACLDITRHIQIASVPSRHEPDSEELNAPYVFEMIDRSGYTGFVGCEYRPRAGTLAGLTWLPR